MVALLKRQIIGTPFPQNTLLSGMFANGELGGVYSMVESPMYQDTAKTMPATSADHPVRVISPVFGSGDATAPNDAARPLLKISGAFKNVTFDKVDDDIKVPLTTPGSLFIATTDGMYWGEFDFSLGQSIGSPLYNPLWPVVGWCAINRAFTLAEIEALKSYFSAVGGVVTLASSGYRFSRDNKFTSVGVINTSNVSTFFEAWANNKLTSFPLIDVSKGTSFYAAWLNNLFTSFPLIDVSSGTNFSFAWQANKLTSFPQLNISKGTNLQSTWQNNLLTSFPYQILQGVVSTNYQDSWFNNKLDGQSVDGILTTIRNNANTLNLNNGTLGINSGTNAVPTNGSVTGMNGIQAKADLIARGWTVNTN